MAARIIVAKSPPPHPTRRTIIKQAPVDAEMVPLVRWLNSFESATTLYCCQGEPTRYKGGFALNDDIHGPYVMFTCTSMLDLTNILAAFGMAVDVTVSWTEQVPTLRYTARFQNRDHLEAFLPGLKHRRAA